MGLDEEDFDHGIRTAFGIPDNQPDMPRIIQEGPLLRSCFTRWIIILSDNNDPLSSDSTLQLHYPWIINIHLFFNGFSSLNLFYEI